MSSFVRFCPDLSSCHTVFVCARERSAKREAEAEEA
jgi:hypothetical protein